MSVGIATSEAGQVDLNAEFKAIASPVIVGRVDTPMAIAVGRGTIQPAAGTRVYVLAANGVACGLLIDGPASFAYRVDDSFSVPLARRNLKRADGVNVTEAGRELQLSIPLRRAAVWGWQLNSGPSTPQQDVAVPTWLPEIMDRRRSPNPARDMLLSAWNAGRGYRWALLQGTGDDFELDVDPQPNARTESLVRLYKLPASSLLPGQLTVERLVVQPIDQPWWQGQQVDLASIDSEIDLQNESDTHATVTTLTRIQALRDGIRLLALSHRDEAFDGAGNREPLTVTALSIEGEPAQYVHRHGTLLVALPRALAKGEAVLVGVRAEGNILARPAGDNYWRLDFGWYPRPGVGGEERAEIRVTVETPEAFVPLAPGETVKRERANGRHQVVTRLKSPMRAAMVAAGKFVTQTEELGGARLHISTYGGSRPAEARRLAQVIFSVRGCFEDWLGVPYPFQDLQVIEMNQWGWGQAPPGVIFITKEALISKAETKLLQAENWARGATERVAHEVAHAWFPHVVQVDRAEENWLSESFADYTSAICLQRVMADQGRGKFVFDRQVKAWDSDARDTGEGASIFLASHLTNSEADVRTWRNLLYARGPLVLHALRQELSRIAANEKEGDRLFFTWIRSIVKNFTFKAAETRHLVGILNQMTKRDWQPWFERFVYGTEIPKLE